MYFPLLPNLGPITLAIATHSGMMHTRQLLALAIPFVSLVPVEILANFHQVAVAVTSASAAGGVTSATVAGGISVTGTGTTGGEAAASSSSRAAVTTARSAVASSASHTNSAASPSGTSTSNGASGSNRFVTYWDNYANMGGVNAAQLTAVTHVILSTLLTHLIVIAFADMTNWATKQTTWQFMESSDGNFGSSTAATLKGMQSGLKVCGALGGWGLDSVMVTAVRGGDSSIATFVANVKGFADYFNLDGIDIDWEFPSASDDANLITFVTQLRAALGDDKLISIALGARVDTTVAAAFNSDTFSKLDGLVDMWNVMTYDYVNRYSTATEQQAGNRVVTTVMDYYEKQGITMEKCNVGFPMNAKYFTLTEICDSSNPIGCSLPGREYYEDNGVDNYKSGWVRFNPGLDSTLGTKGTEWATKMRTQWEARPADGSTEITADVSNAWVDETNNVFWTWLSDFDMKKTCQNWVTSGKVGGAMVWSLNQVIISIHSIVYAQMLIHF
ncbi:chitinase [Cryptococcus gattii EJB2]|uniref:Chitinase n=1 Tax=Cryptococcus gattii EJB2 TaxID=1296103 RepID=A0ABR5BTS8_9TREE|nr:chitinase [Cryptococcus gattii EJB2]